MASFLYIIQCGNGAYYIGITNNLAQRYLEHLSGKGSKYCRAFKVNKLAIAWKFDVSKHELLALEMKLQKESRLKKIALIEEPEKIEDYVQGFKNSIKPIAIGFPALLDEICPCANRKCKSRGNCSECIRIHLTKAKEPPMCFKLRPQWVKDVAKNYKLKDSERMEQWNNEKTKERKS